jgi:hypothetical protein
VSFNYQHRLARYPHATAAHPHLDPAGPSHRVSLLDDHRPPLGRELAGDEVSGERSRGAARRRIFGDPDVGTEEARSHRRVGVERIEAEQVAALGPDRPQVGGELLRIGAGPVEGVQVAHRHQQVGDTGRDHLGLKPADGQLRVAQVERGRERRNLAHDRPEDRIRVGHGHRRYLSALGAHLHRQYPAVDLLGEGPGRSVQGQTPGGGEPPPGPQGIVADAEHLGADGGERSEPPVGLWDRRGKDEGGLGLVELAGDALHQLGGQMVRVRHDGERIAGKGRAGEDVQEVEWGHGSRPRSMAPAPPTTMPRADRSPSTLRPLIVTCTHSSTRCGLR